MSENDNAMRIAEDRCDEAVEAFADGNYDEAIALYNQALEADPAYGDAFTGLAMCHQAKGDIDAAIEVTKRYVEKAPDDILAFTNLSMFYQKKGMIKEAEAAGAQARLLDWKRQLREAKEKPQNQ